MRAHSSGRVLQLLRNMLLARIAAAAWRHLWLWVRASDLIYPPAVRHIHVKILFLVDVEGGFQEQALPVAVHKQVPTMLYALFWVTPWRLNFIYRHFGTLCLFRLHRWISVKDDYVWKCWSIYTGKGIKTATFSNLIILHTYLPIKMGQSVPKHWHIKFRHQGITQKKAYDTQNTTNFEIKKVPTNL
jgi:hypothetical protein